MQSPIITKLIEHVTNECGTIDREAAFDSMLDDCYSFKSVGGPFEYMQPSSVLQEMDPIAYRCGVNDMEDAENWLETNGDYYEKSEVESAHEEFADDIKSEISELESELENEQNENEPDAEAIASLRDQLAVKVKELEEVEGYTF